MPLAEGDRNGAPYSRSCLNRHVGRVYSHSAVVVVEIATTKLYTDHATDATIVRPLSFGCGAIVMTEQNQSRSDERSDGHAV